MTGSLSVTQTLSFAIPSRGRIGDLATDFLTACGMNVSRPNPKQYVARVPSMPDLRIHMQRAADIIDQISQGNADIGITGYDLFLEHRSEAGDVFLIQEDLGFSHARLEIAVPDSWVDVSHIDDLAELALSFRHEGRDLRVATSYPNLVRDFLLSRSIHNFSLVEAGGSVEAAPAMGSADIIADIVQTGTALNENRLKTIAGGTILSSKACLVGCTRTLKLSPSKLSLTRIVLELFDAYLDGSKAFTLTANVAGESEEQIARAGTGRERACRGGRTDHIKALLEVRRRQRVVVRRERNDPFELVVGRGGSLQIHWRIVGHRTTCNLRVS